MPKYVTYKNKQGQTINVELKEGLALYVKIDPNKPISVCVIVIKSIGMQVRYDAYDRKYKIIGTDYGTNKHAIQDWLDSTPSLDKGHNYRFQPYFPKILSLMNLER